jgi:NitT/TauT family transport system ATP-binding protein
MALTRFFGSGDAKTRISRSPALPLPRFPAPRPRVPASPRLSTAAAIQARGLQHEYRGRADRVPALERVDLAVEPGEFVAILGPSGCGKSTLLRILGGLLAPSHGEVQLAGESPALARRRHGIGWLAQDDGLLPWRSVADNVVLPLQVGRGGPVNREVVLETLDRVGLRDSARRYPHELSGGMCQRAALARALVAKPAFLFLDEPFANLDELTRERLGDLLLHVRASTQPTTLLVTHSVTEAVRLADRVLVLSPQPGRVLADQPILLARPRDYRLAGFGACAQHLKSVLLNGQDPSGRQCHAERSAATQW